MIVKSDTSSSSEVIITIIQLCNKRETRDRPRPSPPESSPIQITYSQLLSSRSPPPPAVTHAARRKGQEIESLIPAIVLLALHSFCGSFAPPLRRRRARTPVLFSLFLRFRNLNPNEQTPSAAIASRPHGLLDGRRTRFFPDLGPRL